MASILAGFTLGLLGWLIYVTMLGLLGWLIYVTMLGLLGWLIYVTMLGLLGWLIYVTMLGLLGWLIYVTMLGLLGWLIYVTMSGLLGWLIYVTMSGLLGWLIYVTAGFVRMAYFPTVWRIFVDSWRHEVTGYGKIIPLKAFSSSNRYMYSANFSDNGTNIVTSYHFVKLPKAKSLGSREGDYFPDRVATREKRLFRH